MRRKLLSSLVALILVISFTLPNEIFTVHALTDENFMQEEPSVTETEDGQGDLETTEIEEDQVDASEDESGDLSADSKSKKSANAIAASPSMAPAVKTAAQTDDVAVVMTQDKVTTEYNSVNDAIAAAAKKGTKRAELILQKDITEDVVIEEGTRITLYLNGHTITNKSSHTIYNKSKLTYIYGGETKNDKNKNGTVDNVTHGKAAIYNDINTSIYLYSGNFTRSAEASASEAASGGNSYYVIKNYGYLEISDGVNVKFSDSNPGVYSSLIANGWQDAAKAEAGTNGEPKPSDGSKKATLSIKGGTFKGGQITIKNDDYGVLTVSGGTIIQPSANRAAVANNNTATISGGNIEATGENGQAVYSRYFDTAGANKGQLTITGGSFKSTGNVIQAQKGSSLDISGGTFETTSNDEFIIDLQDVDTAVVKNGKYICESIDKIVNKDDVFADEYEPKQDTDGNFIVDIADDLAVVVVVNKDGNVKNYKDLASAFKNAMAGSTVKLQKNVSLEKTVETADEQPGITLDLNGFNIDGTAIAESYVKGVIYMSPGYGWAPMEGIESKMSVINSKPEQGGEIKGYLPLSIASGDSRYEMAGEIGKGVKLVAIEKTADAVELGTGGYLVYSETTKDLIKNGGFKITDKEGKDRIYGDYANAVNSAANGVITLLHDYNGNEAIYSGSEDGTLDLGGNTYTYNGKVTAIDVNYPNVTFTVKNGKIIATDESCDGAHLIGAPDASEMHNRGLILDGVELTVPGNVYGIVTNGTEEGNTLVLKDSILNVKEGVGIYFPSTSDVTIDNSIINAKHTGVQVCAGNLTVKGDKTVITVTGQPQEKTEGDGSISDGAAVSIINRDGYQKVETVNITEGKFISADGVEPLKAYTFANGTASDWAEAKDYVDVAGGIYSNKINEDYIGDNALISQKSGNKEMFAIGEKAIDKLTSAAKAGDEVTVLKGDVDLDINIDGVIVENRGGGKVTVNGKVVTDTPIETEHIHKTVRTEEKAATCTADGNIEYWYCADCDKYFSDKALTKEIAKEKTIIKANGHKYENGKCTVCGDVTADRAAADEVDKLIAAIGPVDKITLDSYEAIMAANEAYKALTAEQKALVTGIDDLNAAIDAYNALVNADKEEPTDKPEIDKPESEKSPQTADTTNPMLFMALLLASAGAAVALRRKTAK